MTPDEKRLLLTTARVLHAQFLHADEPLEARDAAGLRSLSEALAPFGDDPAEDARTSSTAIEERHLLLTAAQVVRGQVCQAPQAWEDRDRSPARAMGRAFAAAVPPPADDVREFLDRD